MPMTIEYRVKDAEGLRELEKAMKDFPCYIGDIGIAVQKGVANGSVDITPLYENIREIKGYEKVSFKSLDISSDNPSLFVTRGDYTYFIHLKKE